MRGGAAAAYGFHMPEVVGSSPTPASRKKQLPGIVPRDPAPGNANKTRKSGVENKAVAELRR